MIMRPCALCQTLSVQRPQSQTMVGAKTAISPARTSQSHRREPVLLAGVVSVLCVCEPGSSRGGVMAMPLLIQSLQSPLSIREVGLQRQRGLQRLTALVLVSGAREGHAQVIVEGRIGGLLLDRLFER